MGKVNPWTEQAFKKAEQRRKQIKGIPAVVQTAPGRTEEVASELRRLGYPVQSVVSNFIFTDLPEPADFEKVARIRYVVNVTSQKVLFPMAFGIDEIFKRVAITTDPILSNLDIDDLNALGVKIKPTAEIPSPLQAIAMVASEVVKFGFDPLGRIQDYIRGFPPVVARTDWKLVTDTREIMEAPLKDYDIHIPVGIIDTGVNPPPPFPPNLACGMPFTDYECISLTAEPPVDTMSHGSWVTSCAFGKPTVSRYGLFIPVSSAEWYIHMKVFTALGPCTTQQIMMAMEEVARRGARVVNMSLGGPLQGSVDDDPECVLAKQIYEQYGTNFIVAAGNDGEDWTINSPGASPYVLTVGAIDWKTLETSSYSSRGPQGVWYQENKSDFERDRSKYGENLLKPDVAGIGGDKESQIVAACTPWYDGLYDFLPDQFDMMIGTSMATPHVAGLVALAIDRGLINSIDDVKSKMAGTKDSEKGYGLLKWSILE